MACFDMSIKFRFLIKMRNYIKIISDSVTLRTEVIAMISRERNGQTIDQEISQEMTDK